MSQKQTVCLYKYSEKTTALMATALQCIEVGWAKTTQQPDLAQHNFKPAYRKIILQQNILKLSVFSIHLHNKYK
jgi:hypothetical protein